MPYATHDTTLIQKLYIDDDMDLCQLFKATMKLSEKPAVIDVNIGSKIRSNIEDNVMEMEGDLSLKRGAMPERLSSPANLKQEEHLPCGCAYLRAVRHQLEWGSYPTTGGEYLDAIFTHREILFSQPAAHQDCARAFSDLAGMLEKRAWRSDADADSEAMVAFRHEAWVVASVHR